MKLHRHNLSARKRLREFCLSVTEPVGCLRRRSTQTVRGCCLLPVMPYSQTERRPPLSRLSVRPLSAMRPSDSPSRPPCRMPNGSPLRRDGCDNRFPPTGGTNSKDYQSHSHVSRLLFLYRPSLRQSVFRPAHESLHLLPVAIVTPETTGVSPQSWQSAEANHRRSPTPAAHG